MAVSYTVFIEPEVHAARGQLPGHMRQRIRRAIDDLARMPRPSGTRSLDTARLDLPPEIELRRLRVESWRLIYAVNDAESWIWILGIQRRPPYDYDDLTALAAKLRS
jgi:mRNA-degrading endonuclease RelE of RelBE toxin-antitoxin system